MTRGEQRRFVRALTRAVRERLIQTSGEWPADWDGHELRELLYKSFARERTLGTRDNRKRLKAFERAELSAPVRLY